ncbi:hypothetical protein NDU88_000941 [Pleurodeles waltl]|uniref:Uncharacterized protein n=1 Tax=Pleurodeles waltl TaxID=8319 RepID=A0AAV7S600_PLEWA|nr:hypothetical protein NDU88_000941 [Pleurodeles waltl]
MRELGSGRHSVGLREKAGPLRWHPSCRDRVAAFSRGQACGNVPQIPPGTLHGNWTPGAEVGCGPLRRTLVTEDSGGHTWAFPRLRLGSDSQTLWVNGGICVCSALFTDTFCGSLGYVI